MYADLELRCSISLYDSYTCSWTRKGFTSSWRTRYLNICELYCTPCYRLSFSHKPKCAAVKFELLRPISTDLQFDLANSGYRATSNFLVPKWLQNVIPSKQYSTPLIFRHRVKSRYEINESYRDSVKKYIQTYQYSSATSTISDDPASLSRDRPRVPLISRFSRETGVENRCGHVTTNYTVRLFAFQASAEHKVATRRSQGERDNIET